MCNGPQQTTPGYVGSLQQPTQNYGQFAGQRPYTSVPYMQTFGGRGAPWPDLSSQILDAWNQTQGGAGRFGNNAAQRYSFAGPWSGMRGDTRDQGGGAIGDGPAYMNFGGGGMDGSMGYGRSDPRFFNPDAGAVARPISAGDPSQMSMFNQPGRMQAGGNVGWQQGMKPGGLDQVFPMPGEQPPMKQPAGGVMQQPGFGYRPNADPMSGFRDLLGQDPRAASEALNFNPGWFQQNQGALAGMVPGGDLGAWRNQTQPGASNVGAITDAQRALIRQKMGW